MQVGSYIKSRRENIGMSKSKLAREIGVNRTQVIRWESEQTEPTLSNFIKVCDVLGINVDDFIEKEKNENVDNVGKRI